MLAIEMAKSVPALINADVLRWARDSASLTLAEAAERLGYAQSRLEEWEDASELPSIPQLRKMAELYKRPLSVFYLAKPPKQFEAMHDFRRVTSASPEKDSPQFRFEVRRAEFRREAALDLYSALGETPKTFNLGANISETSEAVGARLRNALEVPSVGDQVWRDKYSALKTWRSALEALGVLVFQARGIDTGEFRALSIASRPLPVILLNIKDSVTGRMFSLMHEAAHLVLRRGGVCNLREATRPRSLDERVEVFCNAVAAATLMPREEFLGIDLVARARDNREDWHEIEIQALARRFCVSREAVVRRLLTFKKTTRAFYELKRDEYAEELAAQAKVKKKVVVPPSTLALATVGPLFARLVIEGYNRESITSSDVSEYFGVKLGHLPKIEAALLKNSTVEHAQ